MVPITSMDVSIIILNYKQKGLVKQCVKGILQSHINVSYEIIVVDNHSHDGCIEMLREIFPQVITLASEKNKGFAYGNNLGIQKSRGKYIVIINPDIAFTDNVIENMIAYMEKNKNAGIVAPKLINPDGTIQYSCRRFPKIFTPILRRTFLGNFSFAKKWLNAYLMEDWDHNSNKKVDWIFGAIFMIRKEFLKKVGLFDERFFLYFEDCDLCRRFWEKNYEVWYLADIELTHYHQRLSGQKNGILSIFDKATRIHIASAIKYFAKYLGTSSPRHDKA